MALWPWTIANHGPSPTGLDRGLRLLPTLQSLTWVSNISSLNSSCQTQTGLLFFIKSLSLPAAGGCCWADPGQGQGRCMGCYWGSRNWDKRTPNKDDWIVGCYKCNKCCMVCTASSADDLPWVYNPASYMLLQPSTIVLSKLFHETHSCHKSFLFSCILFGVVSILYSGIKVVWGLEFLFHNVYTFVIAWERRGESTPSFPPNLLSTGDGDATQSP